MRSPRRLLTLLALGILGALALCACTVGSQITVAPDGSGVFSTVITTPGSGGDALYRSVEQAGARSTAPMKVERYSSGAESGARVTVAFRSLPDLSALGASLGSETGIAGIAVARGANGWTMSAKADGALVRPAGSPSQDTGGPINASALVGLVHLSVSIELPGAPGASNADQVTPMATSTRFVWDLTAGREATALSAATVFVGDQSSVRLASALTTLRTPGATTASSSTGSGTAVWFGLAAGAVGLVLVAVVVVVVVRSRRRNRWSGRPGGTRALTPWRRADSSS